jgi:O-antigen ligase
MSAVYLAVALPPLLATLDDRRRRWFMRGIPIGATFALGFILIEELTGHALVLKALAAFPGLLGDNAKEIVRAGGRIVGIEPYYLNPSVASALLLAPPLLLALSLWRPKGLRAIVLTLASLAAGAAVLLSVSETAKIAALAAIVAFAFARRWPRGTLHVLAAILVLGTVLALPIGRLPYALELQDVDWLPVSARERVLIWHHTAETAARRPLFGIGAQSTRLQETAVTASRPADILDRQLGWHAHNVYLQSWLELGAAGTLLLLAAGLAAVRAALALHPAALAFAAALVASVMTIAATGWGMWQPWLIGNVAAAAVLLAMLDRDLRLRSPPPA